ncbi:MAG: hypothetical protein ACJ8G5_02515 [Burkholderiales bacterium]
MRLQIFVLAAALALAAGCNKSSDRAKPAASADTAPPQSQTNTPTTPQVNTPQSPASAGQTASPAEKKEGANPQQGQVDPKSTAQHRDFQQKGDAAGPKSPDTAPKPGK